MWPDRNAVQTQVRRPTWRDAGPFVFVALLGVGTLAVPPYRGPSLSLWVLLALVPATLLVLGYGLRQPARTWPSITAPMLTFAAIGFARDAGGGSASSLGTLVVLPLLWQALTGTARDLAVGAACTVGVFVLPMLLVGAPEYPVADWRRALLWVAFALVIAPRIQAMVHELARGTAALVAEEARWRAIVEHLPDVSVTVVDQDLKVRQVAGAGSAPHGLIAHTEGHPAEIADPAGSAVVTTLLQDALAGGGGDRELTVGPSGTQYVVTATPLPAEGDGRRALMLTRDVSTERERERALLAATQRTERLLADAPHGVMVLDLEGRISRANNGLRPIVGADPEALEGQHISELAPAGDDTLLAYFDEVLRVGGDHTTTGDAVIRNVAGQTVQVSLSGLVLHDYDGTDAVVLLNVVDVSQRRKYELRLAHLADHDALTGLVNRRRFDIELQRHLDRCRRYGPTGALLLLDLDNFKQVNDTLGHNVGDQLIISTAELLSSGLRSTDTVARLGGDEFAILLPQADQAAAEKVAETIIRRLRDYTATLDGTRRRVTASLGVVTFAAAQAYPTDVLALADMTMYDAKEAGRNRYAVLEEGSAHPSRTGARLQWQEKIERALETDGFALLYQPIQDLRTGHVTAAEVLLRLVDGEELVSPSRFLYIAERAGLMPQLDSWVMQRSIARLAELNDLRPGFQLHANLSGHSLGNPEVEDVIARSLARHAIDPGTLVLEVTETAAIADVALAKAFAQRITELGCLFALDDFGAGFGSFYYLKHLQFDFIKIDGEFVSAAPHSPIDRTVMRSIVGIAHELGKETIAEFVSDEAILAAASEEGVDHAQGYLIGEPVPYDQFVDVHLRPRPVSG
ncbi:putative bifunctional diguanylate cyclase/phosphodiesterase [Nocardioides sp. SYSU DS0651]|uniref:putative bifunctional diguanylate cyclase/phosphodiesterase n=1 Tax=Nocardioides sp. SYSU DS0651 TaxID=3415955 RepID=UPI003F4BBBCC